LPTVGLKASVALAIEAFFIAKPFLACQPKTSSNRPT